MNSTNHLAAGLQTLVYPNAPQHLSGKNSQRLMPFALITFLFSFSGCYSHRDVAIPFSAVSKAMLAAQADPERPYTPQIIINTDSELLMKSKYGSYNVTLWANYKISKTGASACRISVDFYREDFGLILFTSYAMWDREADYLDYIIRSIRDNSAIKLFNR